MRLYVVTAINRLTGEREACSAPHSYYKTRKLLQKWQMRTEDCREPAWTDLKVERFQG
jgi:hypothetical protein